MADSGMGGVITVLQNGVTALTGILNQLTKAFPQTVGTSGTATGGAATLPGNPVGFLTVTLPSGATAKVPYYGS